MNFFKVADFDPEDDKDILYKLESAYTHIWDTVPFNTHGRLDEMFLLAPVNEEVVSDFLNACKFAKERLPGANDEGHAVLNGAMQICETILKQLRGTNTTDGRFECLEFILKNKPTPKPGNEVSILAGCIERDIKAYQEHYASCQKRILDWNGDCNIS